MSLSLYPTNSVCVRQLLQSLTGAQTIDADAGPPRYTHSSALSGTHRVEACYPSSLVPDASRWERSCFTPRGHESLSKQGTGQGSCSLSIHVIHADRGTGEC